jgi:hypothetical protein
VGNLLLIGQLTLKTPFADDVPGFAERFSMVHGEDSSGLKVKRALGAV